VLLDAGAIPEGTTLHADVCIAGAGPAGIAVARMLATAGHDVLLAETGGFSPEEEIESLSAGTVATGSGHPSLTMYRRRVIGGTSYVWGGRCTPLDPLDFEVRDWVPYSGWPIAHRDLLPWYQGASDFLDAGRFDYSVEGSLTDKKDFIEGFVSPILLSDRIERFSLPTNVGHKFRAELVRSPTLRLLHHAVATHIRLDRDNGNVRCLDLRALNGSRMTVVAPAYVLALGAIETVRLMLASNDACENGIGNSSGWLGRSYLSHLEGTVGELRLQPSSRPVIWGYEKSRDGVYVRRRFALSEMAQKEHRIGNAVARLHHESFANPSHRNGILSAAFLTKSLLVPEYSRRISWVDRRTAQRMANTGPASLTRSHLMNVVRDLPGALALIPRWIWLRNLRRRKFPSLVLPSRFGTYPLDVNIEQSPNPASRITLLDTRDRFGMPQVSVDWRMNELDRHSIRTTLALIRDALAQSQCGEFMVDVDESIERITPIGGHQMGGARMSSDAKNGVVDANCRVHGVGNLYLAGSQVFPTVGYANPTLTAVALSLRLAAHLQTNHRTA
jgi:choline dehydrogenase-like flavoprotein